ncbi:sulfite exporter TauE/SafE family protein [Alicyclobacillus mengziensis]|uniref:Probable membrane transporter protein n=1 Tax=Alicyclobacillus mengziensis TaxID=2931921 RepID=A0A9X7W0Q7_9BACL|nr:sulfite exporter TauE/SafE family protein [Alicyclobacillus mengziensis]QSO48519.1 sulfite exporter TauE/SafE family protein [Alicyclobacillus mengziensis]
MPHLSALQYTLAILSGGLVGFTLGLLGGGGSILAVPLLLYLVGMHDPHVVIGSTALAVSLNAYANLLAHARAKHVLWKPAVGFTVPGIVGAYVGSVLGKLMPDKQLLFLFAILMIVIAILMLRKKRAQSAQEFQKANVRWTRITSAGLIVGFLSGFFGIGGGFLIVPGLMFSTGMSMIMAIGTSLFAVGTFGLTTAVSYAASGLVDWWVVLCYVAGGIIGGGIGSIAATKLSTKRRALNYIFSVIIFIVAIYMVIENWRAIHG